MRICRKCFGIATVNGQKCYECNGLGYLLANTAYKDWVNEPDDKNNKDKDAELKHESKTGW